MLFFKSKKVISFRAVDYTPFCISSYGLNQSVSINFVRPVPGVCRFLSGSYISSFVVIFWWSFPSFTVPFPLSFIDNKSWEASKKVSTYATRFGAHNMGFLKTPRTMLWQILLDMGVNFFPVVSAPAVARISDFIKSTTTSGFRRFQRQTAY